MHQTRRLGSSLRRPPHSLTEDHSDAQSGVEEEHRSVQTEYPVPHKGSGLLPVLIVALVLWIVMGSVYALKAVGNAGPLRDLVLLGGAFLGGAGSLGLHYFLKRRSTGTLTLSRDGVKHRSADGRQVRMRWRDVTRLRWGGFVPRGLILSDDRGGRSIAVTTYFERFNEIVEQVAERTVDAHRDDPARLSPPAHFRGSPRAWLPAWGILIGFGIPSFSTVSHGWIVLSALAGAVVVAQVATMIGTVAVKDGHLLERRGLRWRRTALTRVEAVDLVPPRARRGGRGTEVDPPAVELCMSTGDVRLIRITPDVLALWAAIEIQRPRSGRSDFATGGQRGDGGVR